LLSPSGPSLKTEDNSGPPGAEVLHLATDIFVTFRAPDRSALVAIGLTPEAAAEFCAGGNLEPGEGIEDFLVRPDGSFKKLTKSGHKVGLLVFPGDAENVCATPIASGSGVFTETDNALLGDRRNDSFGLRIRGQVTNLAGLKQHVLVVYKAVFNQGTGFKENVVKVAVN